MHASYTKQAGWPKLPGGFAFRMVSNIAEDSLGRLYFVHRGARPLVRFDRDGDFLESLGEPDLPQSVNYDLSKNPPQPIGREYWLHGLHVDPWNNIWVTDLGRHLVLKFDPHGRLLMTLGQSGQPGEALDRFNQPTAVVVDRSGHIYVADGYGNSRIVKYSADGRPQLAWGRKGSAPGEFQTPHGLSIDADDNIYVAERMNHRVLVKATPRDERRVTGALAAFATAAVTWQERHGYGNFWAWSEMDETLRALGDPAVIAVLDTRTFVSKEGATPFERVKNGLARLEDYSPRLVVAIQQAADNRKKR